MIDRIKFWLFRVAVSIYGSWKFRIIYPYGFCDDESDRDGYEHDTVSGYFWEAWGRD